jgi:small subunit ribosomal protein S1
MTVEHVRDHVTEHVQDRVIEDWLTEAYDYSPPSHGDMLEGTVLKVRDWGAAIDVGLKRDGFVPEMDLRRLGEDELARLKPGQEVLTRVVKLRDQDDNLILSLYEARVEADWIRAETLLDSGEPVIAMATGYNRGGLLVRFGHVDGFVPASHLEKMGRRLSEEQRQATLQAYVGQELPLKVIEINRRRRRLIVSERLARQALQKQHIERLLQELVEGEVCHGAVSRLTDFGAFVDLGGADGLIHVSELAWHRVEHPADELQVGDEVDVHILNVDHERKRISLSLKRLQPDPWMFVQETYTANQLVNGTVTNVVDFGAFVALETGIEGLVHISELADPPPEKPKDVVKCDDEVVVRILSIDPFRQRLALSLKSISAQERNDWFEQHANGKTADLN